MNKALSRLVCSGCGASPAVDEPYPFRCPNAGSGDIDHVLRKVLDTSQVRFPDAGTIVDELEPFVRYRGLLHSYHRAVAGGVTDAAFVELVRRLDRRVAAVDGHGFAVTPFGRSELISNQLGFTVDGGVWVKDETGNVSGTHKGRHLMGVLLHLEVAEMLGLADPSNRPDLAIASCGNAALAAAVVAAAARRRLRVFVPADADPVITRRLADLGADVVVCPRRPGVAGDPTYLRLLEELGSGALAFSCQGNLNGLAIEGGETLGYEIVSEVGAALPAADFDHLVVQVGGGALASSCVQSFDEARELQVLSSLPRFHTVQTKGSHPLERAYERVRDQLPADAKSEDVGSAVQRAARNRSAYMWPWESEPKSIATGILDDETYDWLVVLEGMLSTGGRPLVVSEERLAEANELGRAAGFNVDPTGSSSLAGLLELVRTRVVAASDRVAILFTGVER